MEAPTSSQRLARLLFGSGHHAAAYLVRHGLRDGAAAIADDLCPIGRTVSPEQRFAAELVRAWGAGHDDLVLAAFAAWDLRDCAVCAHRVLQGLPACADCAEAA